MTADYYVTVQFMKAHREEACRWVADHGFDPDMTPVPSWIKVYGGQVTVEQYVRDEHGAMVLGPLGEDFPRTKVTLPLRRPWPFAYPPIPGGQDG